MKCAIIGVGARGRLYAESLRSLGHTVYLCDPIKPQVLGIWFSDIETLLRSVEIHYAVVSVPHRLHQSVSLKLVSAGIPILKEKPLALHYVEGLELQSLAKQYQVRVSMGMQRRVDPLYRAFKEELDKLGKLYHAEIAYNMCVKDLSEGWRAEKSGRAILDLGYHMVDLVFWYFGKPNSVFGKGSIQGEDYRALDTYRLLLETDRVSALQLNISRLGVKKEETIRVRGEKGSVVLFGRTLETLNTLGELQNKITFKKEKIGLIQTMILDFVKNRKRFSFPDEHVDYLRFIDAVDQAVESSQNVAVDYGLKENTWPVILPQDQQAIQKQMFEALSIYNRSGIFEVFENRWAKMHKRKHALLFNSGTSALMAAYFALKLSPGDVVLAPNYTFFATVSPARFLGIELIFCDCDDTGNVDLASIQKHMNEKVKAIVLTHMWGIPCDIEPIMAFAQYQGIPVIEDCSHAHGAEVNGKLVGSLGDMAVWSLQGAKLVSGGEGGVLVTNRSDWYYEALLLGHYNKRCKQEIPKSYPGYALALTGYGLKLRAHPLAIALASSQLSRLEDWLRYKRQYADQLVKAMQDIPCLRPPKYENKKPAWYALVCQFVPEGTVLSIDAYVDCVKAKVGDVISRPTSTRPVSDLALFKKEGCQSYPQSEAFYQNAIKLSVPHRPEDASQVQAMIEALRSAVYPVTSKL